MFMGALGIRLILLTGKTVPRPASYAVSTALRRVEVTHDVDAGDGFQITFTLGKDQALNYGLLQGGALDPFNRVVIGVLFGASPVVLIDGVITHHQVAPSNQPGMSTFTVTGKDISLMLDLEEKNESYANQPDFVIATRVLANYAQFGLVPQPTPTTDVPIELQRIPRQHETDLQFLQRLAARNGFVFYIEPLTFGVNTAYWGPENRLGFPQPALTMNMGHHNNLTSLNFAHDALAPMSARGTVLDPITKTSIPIPALPSLRLPPLVLQPTPARRTVLLRETAKQNPVQASAATVAAVSLAPEAVTGEGELEVVRYGNVLRARRLVGVRGVGLSYNGNYYVRRVTHILERGRFTQKFKISREGTIPLLPVVRP